MTVAEASRFGIINILLQQQFCYHWQMVRSVLLVNHAMICYTKSILWAEHQVVDRPVGIGYRDGGRTFGASSLELGVK